MYVFYAQIMTVSNSNSVHFAINYNNVNLCAQSSGDGNNWDKASCLATAHVGQGDTVFVNTYDNYGTGHVIHGYLSSFSGFLLSADV